MAWTDFFVAELPNAKTVVSPNGQPYVSMRIEPTSYIEVHLTTGADKLPFQILYRSFDSIGGILEEREYGQAGTKDIAKKIALETANLRLNSREFILDGE